MPLSELIVVGIAALVDEVISGQLIEFNIPVGDRWDAFKLFDIFPPAFWFNFLGGGSMRNIG